VASFGIESTKTSSYAAADSIEFLLCNLASIRADEHSEILVWHAFLLSAISAVTAAVSRNTAKA
jgi:hypothetical protein